MNGLTKKRAGEMYAFLIGTIIGLLIIGAMFFGYGIYKSGTSNSQIFTAVQNGDLNKLSSLRLNNKIPVNTDKIVVFKRGDNTVDLSTLTDTGSAYAYVVSNDPAVSEGVITKQDFFALDDEKIISKGFITPGSSTERIPKYFGVPNSSTISGFTVYETSDTAYFSNAVASAPQTPAPPSYTPENCFTFNTGANVIGGYDIGCGTDVNIPPTINSIPVMSIGSYSFYELGITSVIIPEGVITIEYNSFPRNQLSTITIPNSVTTIGSNAFEGNILSSVTLGTGLQSIGWQTFKSNNITSIYLPPSVNMIMNEAFYGNPLVNIQLYDSVSIYDNMITDNNNFRDVYSIAGGLFVSPDNGVTWVRS